MHVHKVHTRLMGSDFELIAAGTEAQQPEAMLQAGLEEIKRLERLLTEFNDTSDTGRINAQAGIAPVAVAAETYALVQRCLQLSALTQGAFDITAGTLRKLYNFRNQQVALPSPASIRETLALTGYQHIRLEAPDKVFLDRKGCRIGFGAIGKGYAADRVKKLWQQAGITSGVVNASGDLTAWGLQPEGHPWKVGIADPDKPGNILMWLPVDNASVATSGNYEQYFDIGGIRYSHNIDPRTGLPVRLIKSVTIVSPSAELSDALATAVTVMGTDTGLHLIDQLPDVHAVVIDDRSRVFTSQNIKTYA